MDPERWERLQQIFLAASGMPDEQRDGYLREACAGDDDLRSRVVKMLAHDVEATDVLAASIGPGLIQETGAAARPAMTETSAPGASPGVGPSGASASDRVGVSSHPSLDRARFVPGALLDRRYRIVALLGRGGMGEVYRADDLKLGQPVALKFLPEGLERDERRLDRFLNEVRTARQVTHSNVCRVYDIGEVPSTGSGQGGQHYLSMEYVDGEDLSSLLRRIGRLPGDKAVQIARQICLGLHAAHAQRILHRDLKPANVMIDGRGRAKITDFGLAGLEETIEGADVVSGTPAYMAPEQLAGNGVTAQSDLYALGLVLYELFTGKPAFHATTLAELRRLHSEATPSNPSSHVAGIDPGVEQAILRCLEKDPAKRPASALAVATALPGGDPLAAAVAAGETPSPEMVADAGTVGGLRPPVALACLAVTLVGLFALPAVHEETTMVGRIGFEKPREVLAAEARSILREAGHELASGDSDHGFMYDEDFMAAIYLRDPRLPGDVSALRPSPIQFWFRHRPSSLVAAPNVNLESVSWYDPAPAVPGEVRLRTDPQGRLVVLQIVPASLDRRPEPGTGADAETDWSPLFARAGLDPGSLTPVEPRGNPLLASDRRHAWEGHYPDQPGVSIRVEAASDRGRPVYFEVVAPWNESDPTLTRFTTAGSIWQVWLVGALLVGGGLLARRNLRMGRGNWRGAMRLGVLLLALLMLYWALTAHHVSSAEEIWLVFIPNAAMAIWWAGLFGMVWLALEPYVRRLWPELLISWGRLFDNRFRDPMVGRDLMLGGLAGISLLWLETLATRTEQWAGLPSPPSLTDLFFLEGAAHAIGRGAYLVYWMLVQSLFSLFLLLILRIVFRRRWIAGLAWVLFFSIPAVLAIGRFEGVFGAAAAVAATVALLLVLVRFGLLAIFVAHAFHQVPAALNLTFDPSRWYVGQTLIGLALLAALVGYGFTTTLAGRPVFGRDLLEFQAGDKP